MKQSDLLKEGVAMVAGEYNEETSKILQSYLAPGPYRAARLKILNDCLGDIRRAPDGGKLNVVGVMFGSTHVEVRKSLIECASKKGERI